MTWRTLVWVPLAVGCVQYAEGERGQQNCDPYVDLDCMPTCDPYEDPSCDPNDNCPDGEVCSPETPYGLEFGGVSFGDDFLDTFLAPPPTATGGIQTVSVRHDGGALFSLDFEATGDTVLGIEDVSGSHVLIRGLSGGEGLLRIVVPGTGELYDRIRLPVGNIESVDFVPGDFLFRFLESPEGDVPPWAVLRTQTVDLVVRLHGLFAGRLVDESLVLTSDSASATPAMNWDTFSVSGTSATVPYTTTVFQATTGDGQVREAGVVFVSAIDDIVFQATSITDDVTQPLDVNRTGIFCFVPKAGERLVLAGPLTFTAEPGLELGTLLDPCVSARAEAAGDFDLTVSAAGLERTFTLQVRAMAARPAPAAPPPAAAPTPGLGERALSARSAGSTRWPPAPAR